MVDMAAHLSEAACGQRAGRSSVNEHAGSVLGGAVSMSTRAMCGRTAHGRCVGWRSVGGEVWKAKCGLRTWLRQWVQRAEW
eukprot:349912-Chlamydomonas_euryale.AAC.14